MLGTILKPPARFKAVRTVLKPSGRPASQRAAHNTRAYTREPWLRLISKLQERPSFSALTCVKKLGRFASYGEVQLKQYTVGLLKWACIPRSRAGVEDGFRTKDNRFSKL